MMPMTGGANIQPMIPALPPQSLATTTILTRADHWKIERAIAIAMLAIIPGSFVIDSVLLNYLLAASLAIHAHWGSFSQGFLNNNNNQFSIYRNGCCVT